MVLLRYLVRQGFHRGLRGSRVWLWTGVGAYGLITVRRIIRNSEETIFLGELTPGAGIEVVTRDPFTKKERRALKKAGQKVPREGRVTRRTLKLAD